MVQIGRGSVSVYDYDDYGILWDDATFGMLEKESSTVFVW